MEINRYFFDGYAEPINPNEFFSNIDEDSPSLNLKMLLKARIRRFVDNNSLIIKEFELDLYRSEDNRYVIHICRLDGSSNYCDYYVIDRLTSSIKYRIIRALIIEALEISEMAIETGGETTEIEDIISAFNLIEQKFRSAEVNKL